MTQNERRTIMVVEDYDDTRLLLKKGLEGLGYSVLEASNGQEAVDCILIKRFAPSHE